MSGMSVPKLTAINPITQHWDKKSRGRTVAQCDALAAWLQARFEEYPDHHERINEFSVQITRHACLEFARTAHWDLATWRFADCQAGDPHDIKHAIALLE